MAVYKQQGSKNWWFKFTFNGEQIRESTKQSNKRVAEQIEAARKTGLAKGDVGIRDRVAVPTLKEFAESEFLPHIESRFAEKATTLAYYRIQVGHLTSFPPLAGTALDAITPAIIAGFIENRRKGEYEISSINRALQVLRRVFHLAVEWGRVPSTARVRLLPGERRRERVLTAKEETAYLEAAGAIGEGKLKRHERALSGIRALRGEVPLTPTDPFLLRHAAIVLLDCGLRPEECYRLRWEFVTDGNLNVPFGKTANARRVIPLSTRAAAIIEMRRSIATGEWVFPAPTRTGHMEQSTLKSQHAMACKFGGIEALPFYTFRHTCLTRWATHLDPYSLAYFAGHSDFGTTKRYVHPNLDTARQAMERARLAYSGHSIGHSAENGDKSLVQETL